MRGGRFIGEVSARIDALVFQVGPVALVDRPALLGQPNGVPAFARVGRCVVCELELELAKNLADALERVVGRWPSERRRRAKAVSSALVERRPMIPGMLLHALCDLAEDRLAISRELKGHDAVAARVAGEELVLACVQVAALGATVDS
jgi:hypothetical protein